MAMTVDLTILTPRQAECLRLAYVECWSYRKIGRKLNCSHMTAFRSTQTAIGIIMCAYDEPCYATPLVEALFGASCGRSSETKVRSATDQLLYDLEEATLRRDEELAILRSCIEGNWSSSPLPLKKNPYDDWELDYMHQRHRETMQTSDYEARRLMCYAQ